MPADAARVEAIFQAATEIPDAAARSNYLDEACAGDAVLKARILSLLQAHDHPDSLLDQPVVASPDPALAATRHYEDPDNTRAMPGKSEEADDEPLNFLAPSSRPDSLGKIGQYEVLEVLGRGGFGIVFRAFDDRLQRVVAVKVLAPSLATTSPARKRFLREARSSAAVRHENVVQVHAVEEQPLPHLVMEFVPGETLQQRLDRTGPLETAEVLKIGRQIAEGLAAAHATGLIHRDIKPSNILVYGDANPVVKITDFGLARAADDASLTRSGTVAGTPMYMAPEQAKGEPLDHRADLFSLGSVLYVLASGRPPFRASSTLAVLKRVADETPRPIREIIPEVPEWLCRIIEKLHAKDPEQRYQSSRDVAETLADCEEQLKGHGTIRDFARIPGDGPKSSSQTPRIAAGIVLALSLLYAVFFAYQKWIKPFFNGPATDPNTGRLVVEVRESGRLRLEIFKTGEPDTKTVYEHGALGIPFDRRVPVGNWSVVAYYEGVASPLQMKFDLGPDGRTIVVPAFDGPPPPPTALADGWVSLFNGKDLTGWTPAGSWTVQNGILTGTADRPGTLFSKLDDFVDFHLRAEVRVNDGARSGIWFRQNANGADRGYKAIINCDPMPGIGGNVIPAPGTGSLQVVRSASEISNLTTVASPVPSDRWFTMDIIARGTSLTVKVDGKTTSQVHNDAFARGRIGLELNGNQARAEYRKVEIQKLSPTTPTETWSPLFNGKDLTGWTPAGSWTVQNGILTGTADRPATLYSKIDDYANYHLRAEVRVNAGGEAGFWFRHDPAVPNVGYKATLRGDPDDWQPTGSLLVAPGNGKIGYVRQAAKGLTKPDEWFVLEAIADGTSVIVKVNGVESAALTDVAHARGRFGLEVAGTATKIEFRKVEIKAITATVPEVPKCAADILPFIRGTWKRDSFVVVPKSPGDPHSFGQLTFDAVANGTVMRGITVDENGRATSLILHAYDAAKDQIRSWYFSAEGETNASNFGAFDPTSRTFLWLEKFPDGTESVHKLDFVDSNTVRARNYDTDAAGNTVYESSATFTRTVEAPAVPNTANDPKRLAEMAVLDPLVGDWLNVIAVVNPGASGASRTESHRTIVRSVLGGRAIETFGTNQTANTGYYSLLGYDAAAKRYRLWTFFGDGQVLEMLGTWTESTKTLAWTSSDGVRFGHTILKGEDQHETRRAAKNPAGQIVFDATGTAQRKAPSWVSLFNGKDLAGWKAHPQSAQKNWKVENGILTGSGDVSYLFSPAQYANFNLKAEFQVNKAGNGGIYLRSPFPAANAGPHPAGYEVQILGPEAAPSNYQTGGLVNFTDAKGTRIDADTWYTLEIIAHGPNMSVMLNGVTMSDVKDEKNAYIRGHIALQLGDAGTTVRFRKLEILQLPSDPPAGTAPDPDVVKALEAKIAAVESTLANVRASYKEMRVPRAAVIGAESAVIEAKIKLAEEWKRHDEVVKLAGEAVTKQEELHGMMNEQVKAGVLPKSTLDAIDSTIADAKLRLAKAKQNRPETKP